VDGGWLLVEKAGWNRKVVSIEKDGWNRKAVSRKGWME